LKKNHYFVGSTPPKHKPRKPFYGSPQPLTPAQLISKEKDKTLSNNSLEDDTDTQTSEESMDNKKTDNPDLTDVPGDESKEETNTEDNSLESVSVEQPIKTNSDSKSNSIAVVPQKQSNSVSHSQKQSHETNTSNMSKKTNSEGRKKSTTGRLSLNKGDNRKSPLHKKSPSHSKMEADTSQHSPPSATGKINK
jgi:hypothetical protein